MEEEIGHLEEPSPSHQEQEDIEELESVEESSSQPQPQQQFASGSNGCWYPPSAYWYPPSSGATSYYVPAAGYAQPWTPEQGQYPGVAYYTSIAPDGSTAFYPAPYVAVASQPASQPEDGQACWSAPYQAYPVMIHPGYGYALPVHPGYAFHQYYGQPHQRQHHRPNQRHFQRYDSPSNAQWQDHYEEASAVHQDTSDDDSGSEAGNSCDGDGDEVFTPNFVLDPALEGSGWGSLTVAILQNVIVKLSDAEYKSVRLVCRHWRAVLDNNLEQLTPSAMMSKLIVLRFPNLKALHLTNCANVRNRDLMTIAQSGLRLHTLTLGDDSNKPWVTNKGLACIAKITSLTSLNLQDCNSVTNNGLLALNRLRCLQSLSLKGCRKLTSGGLEALQRNTALTSLNLFGCLRIADKGLLPLTNLNLVTLTLGGTKVKDEGLAYLAQITSLQELHFDKEAMTDTGIQALSSLTNLQSLALRDCCDVSGDALSNLIPQLPNLQSLDLYKNFSIDDSQLCKCLEFLGSVTSLDLRGTFVTEDGLQQLTRLSSLQKLCLAPTQDDLWREYMCVISNLTQLTSLTINNCQLITFPLLKSLRQLKLLRELDLSDEAHTEDNPKEPVNHAAMDVMATITSLTSIDLSRRPVHDSHLNVLAERLPRLHMLIIVGCPVLYTEVQALQRRFPELIIHRKPLSDISCNSSDHGGSSG